MQERWFNTFVDFLMPSGLVGLLHMAFLWLTEWSISCYVIVFNLEVVIEMRSHILRCFLIDSTWTRWRIHLGYIMMHHMMACCESATWVLSYGHFLMKVFKEASIDLSRERCGGLKHRWHIWWLFNETDEVWESKEWFLGEEDWSN